MRTVISHVSILGRAYNGPQAIAKAREDEDRLPHIIRLTQSDIARMERGEEFAGKTQSDEDIARFRMALVQYQDRWAQVQREREHEDLGRSCRDVIAVFRQAADASPELDSAHAEARQDLGRRLCDFMEEMVHQVVNDHVRATEAVGAGGEPAAADSVSGACDWRPWGSH